MYAAHAGNNTILSYYEPLVVYDGDEGFRHFATTTVPGLASELSFFRQTIAIVTEKAFIIAEPGNPTYNQIPTFPPELHAPVMKRMMDGARPLAMYQTSENEFLLVYQWGACFVTKCESASGSYATSLVAKAHNASRRDIEERSVPSLEPRSDILRLQGTMPLAV